MQVTSTKSRASHIPNARSQVKCIFYLVEDIPWFLKCINTRKIKLNMNSV